MRTVRLGLGVHEALQLEPVLLAQFALARGARVAEARAGAVRVQLLVVLGQLELELAADVREARRVHELLVDARAVERRVVQRDHVRPAVVPAEFVLVLA